MTAIRPERSERDVPEKTGPDKYAPDRRAPERQGEVNLAAVTAVDGEIREFVRRDISFVRRQRSEPETGGDQVTDNLNSLIRRVSGASMEEIDRVILELQGVRDMLRNEGERVTREIAGYASLSHAAMTEMTVIADSLKQWKNGPKGPAESDRRPAD